MAVTLLSTHEDFDEFLQKNKESLVVVDFFATWCGPCKQIAPKLEELSEKNQGKVFFAKVDVDVNSETAEKHNVTAMPTFKLFKNGKEIAEIVGANYEKLVSLIDSNK